MIFKNPHLLTKVEIWRPKYSTKYSTVGEWVCLPAKYKVDAASPWVLIEFTQAPHLAGQRYCIKRVEAQRYPVVKNGKKATAIDCYEVPMSKLEHWDTVEEVKAIANELFPD